MKLLASSLDTIECAYYLHAGTGCKLDFAALRLQRERMRESKQPEAAVLELGGMEFLLSPNGIYLGIGVTLLAQLEVPFVRLGRRCVYDRVDLDTWLDDTKGERRRAGKDNLWPVMKESTGGPIPASGGCVQRSPTAKEYAKALGLISRRTPKRI